MSLFSGDGDVTVGYHSSALGSACVHHNRGLIFATVTGEIRQVDRAAAKRRKAAPDSLTSGKLTVSVQELPKSFAFATFKDVFLEENLDSSPTVSPEDTTKEDSSFFVDASVERLHQLAVRNPNALPGPSQLSGYETTLHFELGERLHATFNSPLVFDHTQLVVELREAVWSLAVSVVVADLNLDLADSGSENFVERLMDGCGQAVEEALRDVRLPKLTKNEETGRWEEGVGSGTKTLVVETRENPIVCKYG